MSKANNTKNIRGGNCGDISGTTVIPSTFNGDTNSTPPPGSLPTPSSGYPTYAAHFRSAASASIATPIEGRFNNYGNADLEVVNV